MRLIVAVSALMLVCVVSTFAKAPPNSAAIFSSAAVHHPVLASHGMVATQEALASQVGVDILKQGGNAVDAAVAVGFALAVTLPRAGNLGGGGFMMIHNAKSGKTIALDYRETAPSQAERDIFLDQQGEPSKELSRFHGLAVGVPGTVAGLIKALDDYGTMPLKDVIAPAIRLADEGIVVSPDLHKSLVNLEKRLKKWPSSAQIFYKKEGFYQIGDVLKQPDLAASLMRIAEQGAAGFYAGETAQSIVRSVNDAGGIMTLDDLKNYQAIVREPVVGRYRGYEIASMPPPSSGGTHIIQMLNILEGYPIGEMGHNTAETIHTMAEAMKLAYADRSQHLGDPDFFSVPLKGLTSKTYAKTLRAGISNQARPAEDIKPQNPLPYESHETTHYSVVDQYGNAVSNTYTLNFSYGTGMIADGTGILLNNEMDDFSAKSGVPNAYGLLGGEANSVAGGKRPLSSMSPTIVLQNGVPTLVTGSPGGSRIITTTLQIIMNVIDHGMNIAEATHATRIHHQWLPDEIRVEKNLNHDTVKLLIARGHKVNRKAAMGSTQSIMITPQGLLGASDPRKPGAMTVGY